MNETVSRFFFHYKWRGREKGARRKARVVVVLVVETNGKVSKYCHSFKSKCRVNTHIINNNKKAKNVEHTNRRQSSKKMVAH